MIPIELVSAGILEFTAFGGIIHSSPGTDGHNPITDTLVAAICGAGGGLITGMILSKAMRYFDMVRGRRLGHYRWTVVSATLLGGALFCTFELLQ